MVLPSDERVKAKERIKRRVDEIKAKGGTPARPPDLEIEEGESIDGE